MIKTATTDQGFGSNNYLTIRESYKLQCCWWLALKWSHLEVRRETADCELVTDTEHCGVSLSEWMDFEFKDCRKYTQQVSSGWSGAIILDNQQHQEVFYYRSAQEFARPNYTTRTQYSHCQERLLSYCLQLEFQASYCEKCTINRTSYLSGGILEGYVLWKLLSTIASLIAAALAPAHNIPRMHSSDLVSLEVCLWSSPTGPLNHRRWSWITACWYTYSRGNLSNKCIIVLCFLVKPFTEKILGSGDKSFPRQLKNINTSNGSWIRPFRPPESWIRPSRPPGSWIRPSHPPGSWIRPSHPPGSWIQPFSPAGLRTGPSLPPFVRHPAGSTRERHKRCQIPHSRRSNVLKMSGKGSNNSFPYVDYLYARLLPFQCKDPMYTLIKVGAALNPGKRLYELDNALNKVVDCSDFRSTRMQLLRPPKAVIGAAQRDPNFLFLVGIWVKPFNHKSKNPDRLDAKYNVRQTLGWTTGSGFMEAFKQRVRRQEKNNRKCAGLEALTGGDKPTCLAECRRQEKQRGKKHWESNGGLWIVRMGTVSNWDSWNSSRGIPSRKIRWQLYEWHVGVMATVCWEATECTIYVSGTY